MWQQRIQVAEIKSGFRPFIRKFQSRVVGFGLVEDDLHIRPISDLTTPRDLFAIFEVKYLHAGAYDGANSWTFGIYFLCDGDNFYNLLRINMSGLELMLLGPETDILVRRKDIYESERVAMCQQLRLTLLGKVSARHWHTIRGWTKTSLNHQAR